MNSKEIVKVLNQIYDEIKKGSRMYVFVNDVMLTNNLASLVGEDVRLKIQKPDANDSQYWLYVISGTAVVCAIMGDNIKNIRYEVRA